jgi:hypothetical protein
LNVWPWLLIICAVPVILSELVGEAVWRVVRPIVRPIVRLGRRVLDGVPLGLLWIAVPGSYLLLPYSQSTSSTILQTLGVAAFVCTTPLALMATLRRRRTRPSAVPVRGRVWTPR